MQLDVYHEDFEDGLGLTPGPCEDNLGLESMDHWTLHGFNC